MIAVIISIILVIVGVVVIIYNHVNYSITSGLGLLCITVAFWISLTALIIGQSIYKQDNTKLLMEKQTIEYVLENKPDYYIFEKAKEYNHEVNNGNNYFCRFNIEDRSEFEINIGKYLVNKKYKEE